MSAMPCAVGYRAACKRTRGRLGVGHPIAWVMRVVITPITIICRGNICDEIITSHPTPGQINMISDTGVKDRNFDIG